MASFSNLYANLRALMSRKRKIAVAVVLGVFALAFAATHIPIPKEASGPGISHFDKLVHASIYLVLGTGLFVVLKMYHRRPAAGKLLLAIVALAVYAAIDESTQMFIPSRQAEFLDWVANLTGILLAALAVVVRHTAAGLFTAAPVLPSRSTEALGD